jgi:hypothetical protein
MITRALFVGASLFVPKREYQGPVLNLRRTEDERFEAYLTRARRAYPIQLAFPVSVVSKITNVVSANNY